MSKYYNVSKLNDKVHIVIGGYGYGKTYHEENKQLKEVIEKIKDIFDNGTFEDGCDCILIEKLLEDKEVE